MNAALPEQEILQELQRIVDSDAFAHADQLGRLLTVVVTETLAGRQHTLDERTLAAALYGGHQAAATEADIRHLFDLLRDRLQRYYHADGRANPLRIHLPPHGWDLIIEPALVPHSDDTGAAYPILAIDTFDCTADNASQLSFFHRLFSELCLALAGADDYVLVVPGLQAERGADSASYRLDAPFDADLLMSCHLRTNADQLYFYAQLVDGPSQSLRWMDTRVLPLGDDWTRLRESLVDFLTAAIVRLTIGKSGGG